MTKDQLDNKKITIPMKEYLGLQAKAEQFNVLFDLLQTKLGGK